MTLQEEKMALEKIQQQFEAEHTELKNKLKDAQSKKDFKQVLALLNEERELVRTNSERMLAVMAASKS